MEMLRMNSRAVIFDLDGTLVDSVPDVAASLNKALDLYGGSQFSTEIVKSMIGQGAGSMIKKAIGHLGWHDEEGRFETILRKFLGLYSAQPCNYSQLFPGAAEILETLESLNYNLGICTNKPQVTTDPVLQAFNLNSYFSAIVCGDKVSHQKPDKRHIFQTLEQMGTKSRQAVFVGDSVHDIEAARNAGIPSIVVPWGYSQVPVTKLRADALVDDFSLLPEVINRLWKEKFPDT